MIVASTYTNAPYNILKNFEEIVKKLSRRYPIKRSFLPSGSCYMNIDNIHIHGYFNYNIYESILKSTKLSRRTIRRLYGYKLDKIAKEITGVDIFLSSEKEEYQCLIYLVALSLIAPHIQINIYEYSQNLQKTIENNVTVIPTIILRRPSKNIYILGDMSFESFIENYKLEKLSPF